MPVNNLNLYDILVDFIPGTIAVGLVFAAIGPRSVTPAGGLALLVVGYVVGRLLHAIGSIAVVGEVMKRIEDKLLREYTEPRKYGLSFRNRLRTVYDDDVCFDEPADYRLQEEIVDSVVEELETRLEDTDIRAGNLQTHEEIDDVKSLRYFGENFLYGRNTLYRKYEMLATFYRSVWLVSITVALVYLGIVVGSVLNASIQGYPLPLRRAGLMFFLAIVLLVVGLLLLRQRVKFRFKKTRAFINDLYNEFGLDSSENESSSESSTKPASD